MSLLLIPIFVYILFLLVSWLIPERLLFQPQPATYRDDDQIVKLKTSNGETISARFYENATATFTILFSHGNAEDLGTVEPFLLKLRDGGFSILVYDYRGYGTSDGTPSENNTYGDIDAAYKYLTVVQKIPPSRIILHGRSVGGGPSTDLASRETVGGLILESAFTSASRVLTRIKILPFDIFENISKIPEVKCPVLVIHGKKDWTIPFHHGESLFAAAKEPKMFFGVDTAGHNDLFMIASEQYLKAIRGFSETLPR